MKRKTKKKTDKNKDKSNLDAFFSANSIAVIGVSRDPKKIGHAIFSNLLPYKRKLFPINPNAQYILNYKCYPSILNVKDKIDLAIIAIPAQKVLHAVQECGKKGIKNIIIISSGFKEIGNYKLEKKLSDLLQKYKIKCIGPNCLGTFDTYTKLDTLFIPRYKLIRPTQGGISFICQSGAVGAALLDMAASQHHGFSKFISYGNAVNTDESDLLEYLASDAKTKVICLYLEGLSNGRKFFETAKKVSKQKPIIAIKAGKTEKSEKAVISHTGALAGKAEIYHGVFSQAGIIEATQISDIFDFAKIIEKCSPPKGNRIQIITNGGGYGILATDAITNAEMEMAELSPKTKADLKKKFPPTVTVDNPLDLTGDATAERYETALSSCIEEKNVDILLIIILYQTPLLTEEIIKTLSKFNEQRKKPIIVISIGGESTEKLKKRLEIKNIPAYSFPENAVRAIKAFCKYYPKK